jgi:predicted RNA-binding Zn ribbon-like protein
MTVSHEPIPSDFRFVANLLCLDFVNTLSISNGVESDTLTSDSDVINWCIQAGIVDPEQKKSLFPQSAKVGEQGKLLNLAISFRSELLVIAAHIVTGRPIPASSIEQLNEVLRTRSGYNQLIREDEGFTRKYFTIFNEPVQLIEPIAESAAELLSEGDLSLVKKCENTACFLFFYDNTKNHARRWCSMSGCGNRAKAAAHYRRKRKGLPQE